MFLLTIFAEVHRTQVLNVFLVPVRRFINESIILSAPLIHFSFSDPVDHTSNVRVSSSNTNSGRRDSWDVINKTKNILSHNSLESLANMPETQLNTDLAYGRPRALDSETEYNTRYNKFELVEKKTSERISSDDQSDRYRIYS